MKPIVSLAALALDGHDVAGPARVDDRRIANRHGDASTGGGGPSATLSIDARPGLTEPAMAARDFR